MWGATAGSDLKPGRQELCLLLFVFKPGLFVACSSGPNPGVIGSAGAVPNSRTIGRRPAMSPVAFDSPSRLSKRPCRVASEKKRQKAPRKITSDHWKILLICCFHAIFMPFPCHFHAIFKPFSCHFHAISTCFWWCCLESWPAQHPTSLPKNPHVSAMAEHGSGCTSKCGCCVKKNSVYIYGNKMMIMMIINGNTTGISWEYNDCKWLWWEFYGDIPP